MSSDKSSSQKYPSDLLDEEWDVIEKILKKMNPTKPVAQDQVISVKS